VVVDVRTYRVKPGKMPQELDLYAKRGLAAQIRHLGPPLAYLHGESGDINAIVHLWVFEDAADRARTQYGGAEGYGGRSLRRITTGLPARRVLAY
jgi:hypothetical protein